MKIQEVFIKRRIARMNNLEKETEHAKCDN